MTVPNLPGNSHRSKAAQDESVEDKKIERVVTGQVQLRRPSFGKRLAEIFFPEGGQNVMAYLVRDVMVPSAKDMLFDIVNQGVERKLYGESRGPRSRGPIRSSSTPTRVSYTNYSRPTTPAPTEPRVLSSRARSLHEFQEIVLESRAEAMEVLQRLYELLEQYEQATVADLYGLVGVTAAFTDQKYGWRELRGSRVVPIRGGNYLLDIPAPEPLS